MEIVIQKNKEYAFQSFFVGLKGHSKKKSAQFDFLPIPQDILEKAKTLRGINKNDYSSQQIKDRMEIEGFFDRLWQERQAEINKTREFLNENERYIYWMKEKIPLFTSVPWPYEKIFIFPNIVSWAQRTGQYISMGITPPHFLKEDFVSVLAHELIHVNIAKLEPKNLQYPQDSEEIGDNLVTNEIIKNLNSEFDLSIRDLKLPLPFRDYGKDLNYLNKSVAKSNRFSVIIKEVDDFLVSRHHKEVYKKIGSPAG